MKVVLKGCKGSPVAFGQAKWEAVEFTIQPEHIVINHSDLAEPLHVKRSELLKLLRLLEMY